MTHAFTRKRLAIAIAVAFRWDFQRRGLCFETRPGSYTDLTLMEFLTDLKRAFRGRRVILVWDALPSHKSRPRKPICRRDRGSRSSACPATRPSLTQPTCVGQR